MASKILSRSYQMMRLTVETSKQDDVRTLLTNCCFGEKTRATLVTWEWDSSENLGVLTYRVSHRGVPDLQRISEGVVETQIKL